MFFPFNRDKNSFTVSITFPIHHVAAARRRNKVTIHGIASPYTSRPISMCLVFFMIYLFTYSNAMVSLSEYSIKHTESVQIQQKVQARMTIHRLKIVFIKVIV